MWDSLILAKASSPDHRIVQSPFNHIEVLGILAIYQKEEVSERRGQACDSLCLSLALQVLLCPTRRFRQLSI